MSSTEHPFLNHVLLAQRQSLAIWILEPLWKIFDGLGSFKKRDVFGNRLRQEGEILFPGQTEAIQYKTSEEMMEVLADSDRVAETLVWKLTQFAVGRPLGAREAALVQAISEEAKARGGTYAAAIGAIATSDLMRN